MHCSDADLNSILLVFSLEYPTQSSIFALVPIDVTHLLSTTMIGQYVEPHDCRNLCE